MNATEVPATAAVRFDVFLRCAPAGRIEKALRAAGLRVFRGNVFDDFDKCAPALAASRVLLAEHADGLPAGLAIVPGEPVGDLVRRVRGRLGEPPGSRCLWTVHSELLARRAVLVRGLPGIGKTTLAEQYAGLFGWFGGRVLRTGPFGGLEPDDFLPQFQLALAAAAGPLSAGGPVLLLVDDVPAGLLPGLLDRVPPPGPVRTLLTARSARWSAATVDVPGLTVAAALRRFPALGPPSDAAVRRFVTRCEGHPMTLRATASARGQGLDLDAAPDTAPHAIRNVLRMLGPLSRELLRLGSVLAPAPIPLTVATAALGSPVEAAVEELIGHGFATRVGDDLRLQALAVEVAAREFGEPDPGGVAEAVARELACDHSRRQVHGEPGLAAETAQSEGAGSHPRPRTLAEPDPSRAVETALHEPAGHHMRATHLLQHARVLAERVPALRVALLRPLAAAHEAHGDPATAGEIHAAILSTGEATAADFTAAARVELACGLGAEALEHARAALALATGEPERRAAGLVAAQALHALGDHVEADRTARRSTP